jgi:hypothetical protein
MSHISWRKPYQSLFARNANYYTVEFVLDELEAMQADAERAGALESKTT